MVSVIVCTYNRCAILPDCLHSLAHQDYPPDQYEIIVIDNNSTDMTAAVFKKISATYPNLKWRYFFEPVQGLSAARNRGTQEAQGELVVFIDDDATAAPDWLKYLVQPFKSLKTYAVGGRIELKFLQAPPAWLGKALRRCLGEFQPAKESVYLIDKKRGAMPFGGNLAFRKAGLIEVGGFNLQLGRCGSELLAGEETEVLLQLQAKGWEIAIQPQAMVKHLVISERINSKKYFIKGFLAQKRYRLRFLGTAGILTRICYLIRFMLEFLGRGLDFIIRIGFIRDPAQRFLRQRELYGIGYKFWLALNYLVKRESKL